jgi:hypothetical protein
MHVRQRSRCTRFGTAIALCCLLLLPASNSFGLIFPVDPHGDGVQTIVEKLPLGVEEMVALPSCLNGWEGPPFGGGQYWFDYAASGVPEFNEALKVFAAIHRPALELAIHDGPRDPNKGPVLGGLEWKFTVWHPASWHQSRSKPDAAAFLRPQGGYMSLVPPPRIDVYVVEGIDWGEVVIPPNLTVTDTRAGSAPIPVEGGGVIRGVVYDMSTGRPIRFVKVTLTTDDGPVPTAVANEFGEYQIKEIGPPGRYDLKFEEEGYATRLGDYLLQHPLQYDEINVELVESASVQGVARGAGEAPIAGVEIEARNILAINGREYECDAAPVMTDDQGRFKIDGLPRGHVQLRCSSRQLYKSGPFDMVEVPSEDVGVPIEVTGAIAGRVLGAPDGERLHIHCGALDRKPSWGGSKLCEEDGSFAFDGVPPGRYWVSTVPQEILQGAVDPTAQIVEVKPGGPVEVDVLFTTYGEVLKSQAKE